MIFRRLRKPQHFQEILRQNHSTRLPEPLKFVSHDCESATKAMPRVNQLYLSPKRRKIVMQFSISPSEKKCENFLFALISLTCWAVRGRLRATEAAKRADNIDILDFILLNREKILCDWRSFFSLDDTRLIFTDLTCSPSVDERRKSIRMTRIVRVPKFKPPKLEKCFSFV